MHILSVSPNPVTAVGRTESFLDIILYPTGFICLPRMTKDTPKVKHFVSQLPQKLIGVFVANGMSRNCRQIGVPDTIGCGYECNKNILKFTSTVPKNKIFIYISASLTTISNHAQGIGNVR